MQSVKIKRSELLEKIKANRAAHVKDYDEAMVGYRQTVFKKLEEALAEIKSGGKIITRLDLVAPVTQAEDYDRAIAMLEMSVDDVIELSAHEFDNYVLDNWSWKNIALTANAMYKGR
jgi:hypothetical protein